MLVKTSQTFPRSRVLDDYYHGLLWVCSKRLEKGRLGWPVPVSGQDKVVLSQEELALLLGGIDLAGTRRRRWYRENAAAGQ